MKEGKNYRLQDLGRMAVFYIPSAKAREKDYDKKIRNFLLEEFGACTATLGNFCGWWKSDKNEKIHYDESIEFKTAFVGKERIPILASFLAKAAKDLGEECIYLETGEDAWLIYPKDDLREDK